MKPQDGARSLDVAIKVPLPTCHATLLENRKELLLLVRYQKKFHHCLRLPLKKKPPFSKGPNGAWNDVTDSRDRGCSHPLKEILD